MQTTTVYNFPHYVWIVWDTYKSLVGVWTHVNHTSFCNVHAAYEEYRIRQVRVNMDEYVENGYHISLKAEVSADD